MAIIFPSDPSINDTHTVDGATWAWTGDYWKRLVGSITTVTPTLTVGGAFEVNGATVFDGTITTNASASIGGHVIPDTNITYDLGSATNRFRDIYLSGSSINLGDVVLSATATGLSVEAGGNPALDFATESYVDTAISDLIGGAPEALNTLNELAVALDNDESYASTITTALAGKLDSSSYTAADVLAKLITVDGTGSSLDADTLDGSHASAFAASAHTHSYLSTAGGTLTGDLTVSGSVQTEGPDGGLVLRNWQSNSDYGMLGTANMAGNEYSLLTQGGHTYISAASSSSIYIRPNANNTTNQAVFSSTGTTLGATSVTSLSSTGNVGIGTTSPASLLTVMHAEPDGSVDFSKGIVFMRSDGAGGGWMHAGITSVGYTGFDGGIVFGTNNDGSYTTSGIVEKIRITDSGNVGIGTTAPAAALSFANITGNKIDLYHNTAGSGDRYGLQVQSSELRIHSGAGGSGTGGITLGKSSTTAFTEHMRITNNGNVGIGTASPATLLHVSSGTSGDAELRISADTDNSNEGDLPYLSFTADGGIIEGVVGLNDNTLVISNSVTSSAGIDLRTAGTNTYTTAADQVASTTSRLFINSSGNVGINDTTPSYRLDVNGPEDTASRVNISSGNTAFRYHMRFTRNGGLLANGIFSDTGTTYFGNASDVNLKTGISDLSKQDALAAVSALRPVEYRYLLDTEDVVRKGFIAQEMVEVIPEAVHRVGGGHPATSLIYDENGDLVATDVDENGDPIIQQEPDWMLTWEPITTTLVAAVQAQQELIQELTARIEALEAN
jgi:hypothetical protein